MRDSLECQAAGGPGWLASDSPRTHVRRSSGLRHGRLKGPPIGAVWQKAVVASEKLRADYAAVGRGYSGQREFRARWASLQAATLRHERMQHRKSIDIHEVAISYLPVSRMVYLEGNDEAAREAVKNIALKRVDMFAKGILVRGRPAMLYNADTLRYDLAYVKSGYSPRFEQMWQAVVHHSELQEAAPCLLFFSFSCLAFLFSTLQFFLVVFCPREAVATKGEEGTGDELQALTPPPAAKAKAKAKAKGKATGTGVTERGAADDGDDDEEAVARKQAKRTMDGHFKKLKTTKDTYNLAMASTGGLVRNIEADPEWRWAAGVDLEQLVAVKDEVQTCVQRSAFWTAWATYDTTRRRQPPKKKTGHCSFSPRSSL